MAVVYRHRLVPMGGPTQFRGHGSFGRGQLTASVEVEERRETREKKKEKKKLK